MQGIALFSVFRSESDIIWTLWRQDGRVFHLWRRQTATYRPLASSLNADFSQQEVQYVESVYRLQYLVFICTALRVYRIFIRGYFGSFLTSYWNTNTRTNNLADSITLLTHIYTSKKLRTCIHSTDCFVLTLIYTYTSDTVNTRHHQWNIDILLCVIPNQEDIKKKVLSFVCCYLFSSFLICIKEKYPQFLLFYWKFLWRN